VTSIELHGVKLELPNDHWLPRILTELPGYCENIGRLAAAVERKYPGRGFIDIGANIGYTAAIVRAQSNLPILCIEGSEFYYELLKQNVRQLKPEVELECALVDSASAERQEGLPLQYGKAALPTDSRDGASKRLAQLDSILARHLRFQSSKILKIDTIRTDGSILAGALEWISAARPVLSWGHDMGRDEAAAGPGLGILERLLEIGYRDALLFDNTGEFIQTVSLEARQQLADLSGYLLGGEQFHGYCDVCAFHEEDLDLCSGVRRIELEGRRARRKTASKPLNEPLENPLSAELQVLRAQTQFDRYRQQLQITDLETRVSSKDEEIYRLHVMLRELLVELLVERSTKNRREEMLRQAEVDELKGQLASARNEGAGLRHELESSITLRAAKSLGWILGPLRRALGRSSSGGRS
jgi:FkbM family methyltransferase